MDISKDIEYLIKENNLMLKLLCKQLKINSYSQRMKLRGEDLVDKVDELTKAGYSLRDISAMLGVSVPTVSSCRRTIKQRNTVEVENSEKVENYIMTPEEEQAALDAMLDFPLEYDID